LNALRPKELWVSYHVGFVLITYTFTAESLGGNLDDAADRKAQQAFLSCRKKRETIRNCRRAHGCMLVLKLLLDK